MAQSKDVLGFLIPSGGYVVTGEEYEGITFIEAKPITKAQWQAGFAQYDAWKAEQDAKAEADKLAALAKLAALGLNADDLKALGL
jgi:hypothetical protein